MTLPMLRANSRCRKRLQRDDGFTLLEVVLALVIFALMGGILYGAYSLSHSAVEKSDHNAARNQKQRAITDLLGSYIRSAYPYRESAQDQGIYFDGDSDSLSFVSAYSQGLGGRGMARIQISRQEDGNGRGTIKAEENTPVRIGGDGGVSHAIVLQEGVKDFRLAYLDSKADDDKWEERWDGRERRGLPRAVRISFTGADGKEMRWVFPIMISALAQ